MNKFFVSGGPDTNEEVHQRMHFHGYTRNNVDSYWHRDGERYRVYRISSTERTVVQMPRRNAAAPSLDLPI